MYTTGKFICIPYYEDAMLFHEFMAAAETTIVAESIEFT